LTRTVAYLAESLHRFDVDEATALTNYLDGAAGVRRTASLIKPGAGPKT